MLAWTTLHVGLGPLWYCRLHTVVNAHGQVAYRRGSVIGWLPGKIMPENTAKSDDRLLDVVRRDIEGEPVICQIDCRDSNNDLDSYIITATRPLII